MNYEITQKEDPPVDSHETAVDPPDYDEAIALRSLTSDLLEKIGAHPELTYKFESISKSITLLKNEADAVLVEQEGYMKTSELAEELGVALNMVGLKASSFDPEVFGEVLVIGRTKYYSPEQQRMLTEGYDESKNTGEDWYQNRHESRKDLEGYKNRKELSKQYGVPLHRMLYIINSIDKDLLGHVEYVKPSRGYSGGAVYSPEQQEVIREKYEVWQRKNGRAVLSAAKVDPYRLG